MIAPLILLLAALAGLAYALTTGATDLLLLAAPCALASLYLLLRAVLRGQKALQQWVIIDGSNVMHWNDAPPSLTPVRAVVSQLQARGLTPAVVFDANAGYKIDDRYLHHHAMSKLLGLPEDQVMVVPKGTPADPIVLAAARDHKARVVSNDRFRDWATAHPEVTTPGHLIRGGYRDGTLWLDLDPPDQTG